MTAFNGNLVYKNSPNNSLSFINTRTNDVTEKNWENTNKQLGTIRGPFLYRKNVINNNLIVPTWYWSGRINNLGEKQVYLKINEINSDLKIAVIDSIELFSPFRVNPLTDVFYFNNLFRESNNFYSFSKFAKLYSIPDGYVSFPEIFETSSSVEFLIENFTNKKNNLLINLTKKEDVKIEKISELATSLFGNCDINKLLYTDGKNKFFYANFNNLKGGLIFFDGNKYQKFENNSSNFNYSADFLNTKISKGPLGNFFAITKTSSNNPNFQILEFDGKNWKNIYELPAYSNEIIDFEIDEKNQIWIKDRAGFFKLNRIQTTKSVFES